MTANLTALRAAIEALAKATEGSRELDEMIAAIVGWKHEYFSLRLAEDMWAGPNGRSHIGLPEWSSSLDAALTLVPEGWLWSSGIQNVRERIGPLAFCWQEKGVILADGTKTTKGAISAHGPNPAIALCLAALRARLAVEGGEG